ncbi:MAG: T9SS type A sorting domain-containing protein [Bacteroidia bacterium]
MKKVALYLLVAFSAMTERATAQIGTMTGTGMSICNQYSFTICPEETISPLVYNGQNYACDNRQHEDISFTTMGLNWRVEIYSWFFVPSGVGATLTGFDQANNPVTIAIPVGQQLNPISYTNILGVDYVQLQVNFVNQPLLNRNNFQITLNPVAPLNASFTVTTTNGGVQGSSNVVGNHIWTVYSTPNGNAGPYTFIGTYNTATFAVNTGGPCYYVKHQITDSLCGSGCAAQSVCAMDCDVVLDSLSMGGTDVNFVEQAQMGLNIFPNPTNSEVSFAVETANDVAFTISIYDVTGKEVDVLRGLKTSNKKATVLWNTASLSKGTYLVRIVTADQQTINQKLIVE